jgi:hypothetical protein
VIDYARGKKNKGGNAEKEGRGKEPAGGLTLTNLKTKCKREK